MPDAVQKAAIAAATAVWAEAKVLAALEVEAVRAACAAEIAAAHAERADALAFAERVESEVAELREQLAAQEVELEEGEANAARLEAALLAARTETRLAEELAD